ncbi:RraA family protein [Arthrobacter sp. I2-34]|uniref:Putative 4-hydroxy-4-methyl-2-oxoglutarate aldolase n=1 Tax=Arthrobacter hankyongi TaxID=2904801 RepID=A0ABS9L3T5_9MICC|nr:RraA family protein [Arthrobacter hankyongi]MCG2621346.1 RraA family protein [Arthrobacter hankyongi]
MTDRLIERLRRLDACAVSDAMDRLGLEGVALGLQPLTADRRISGRATTVRLVPAEEGVPSARHLGTAAVEASGPDNVIVVDQGGRTNVSGWGGILSLAAVQRCVQGVIVDGACRDVDESRELGLPIFARNAVPLTARGRVVEQDWNVPVQLCGIEVAPDSYVIADGSGVVFLPAAHAEEIIAAAEAIWEREQAMAAQVKNGVPVSEVMGARYETMLKEHA